MSRQFPFLLTCTGVVFLLFLGLGILAQAGIVFQRPGDNFVAFEAEHADTLNSTGSDWRIIDTVTPYLHPKWGSGAKTQYLLPTGTNASGNAAILHDFNKGQSSIAIYKIYFTTPGTYRWYIRDGAFESGVTPENYGNEDSMFRPPAFNVDPVSSPSGYPGFDPTFHGFSGKTEGQYGWRNTSFNFTVSTPGVVEFRIRPRETGFSIDRMAFSLSTVLNESGLDGLKNAFLTQAVTEFTAGGGDGQWSNSANWTAGVPTATAVAFIGNSHTVTLSQAGAAAQALTLGHATGTYSGNGTLQQTGGDLTIGQYLGIGLDGYIGNYTATGTSRLTVGSPDQRASFYIARSVANITTNPQSTFDLSQAAEFTAYLDEWIIGQRVGGSEPNYGKPYALVKLAPQNTIDARNILIGQYEIHGSNALQTQVRLGANNTIKTDLLTVAGGRGNVQLDFLASGGTFSLRGSSGEKADLRIAYCTFSTGNVTTGVMDLTGGTFNAQLDEVVIGYRVGRNEYTTTSTGTLTFNAGTVTANSIVLGQGTVAPDGNGGQGVGILNIGGGTLTVTGNLQLGLDTTVSEGTINLTGGSLTVKGNLTGGVGTSTINADGGTLSVQGNLQVKNLQVGAMGRTATTTVGGQFATLAGGTLRVGFNNNSTVTTSTSGTLDLRDSSAATISSPTIDVGVLNVDRNYGVEGTLHLPTAGSSTISTTAMTIGYSTAGYTPMVRGFVYLGPQTTIETTTLYIGMQKAQGTMAFASGVSEGVLQLIGPAGGKAILRIGYVNTTTSVDVSRGTLDLSGGSFNAMLSELTIGYHLYPWTGTAGKVEAVMTMDAGSVTADVVTIGYGQPPGSSAVAGGGGIGTLNLRGGTLQTPTLQLGVGGSDRARGTVNFSGGTLTADQILKGSAGTAVFNWTGGTLHVGTFGSSDTPFDLSQLAGVLAPGSSIGATTIYGNYSQAPAGVLEIEIASPTSFDTVSVSGTTDLQGTLMVKLLDGYTPATGSTFDVLTSSSGIAATGLDLAWDSGSLLPAQYWTYQILDGQGTEQILQLQVGVPEPASFLLALLAGMALAGYAWQNRRRT